MKKALNKFSAFFMDLVPGAGLEPARLAAGDFESPTSTNFITRARVNYPKGEHYRRFAAFKQQAKQHLSLSPVCLKAMIAFLLDLVAARRYETR